MKYKGKDRFKIELEWFVNEKLKKIVGIIINYGIIIVKEYS